MSDDCRTHSNDEKKIYELLVRIFRSPELMVKLTEHRADYHCVRKMLSDDTVVWIVC